MNVVFTILAVLVILASVFLTIVVLLQNSKGGGLASNFAAGNQAFGVRQTADILEKITWSLVAFIFVVSVVSSFVSTNKAASGMDVTEQIEKSLEESRPQFPAAAQPGQGAPAQEAPATEE